MQGLSTALASGKDVKLSESLTVNSSLTIPAGKNITIDLGGETITATDDVIPFQVAEGATLTIKNGIIDSKIDAIKVTAGNATVNIGSDAVVTSATESCIWIPKEGEGAVVDISGTLSSSSAGSAAVSVNGNLTGNKKVTMNIKGGKITSTNSTAVYFPADGDLTISGGELTGKENAVEYRGTGLLKITAGTFKTTAAVFSTSANSNGTTVNGAAVAVSPHNGRTPNVQITGGDFIAENPTECYAFWEGPVNTGAGVSTVTVSGWTTTGLVHSSQNSSLCTDSSNH